MSDLAWRVLALHWLKGYIAAQYETAKTEMRAGMKRGAVEPARTPDDRKLGNLSMSDPKPQVRVTDNDALLAWYERHYPDHIDNQLSVTGSDEDVLAVLTAYAPHLLGSQPRLKPWARAELEALSAAAGEPVGPGQELDLPGVEVYRPQPTLTPRLSKDADEVMASLVPRLTLDGSLREIEART